MGDNSTSSDASDDMSGNSTGKKGTGKAAFFPNFGKKGAGKKLKSQGRNLVVPGTISPRGSGGPGGPAGGPAGSPAPARIPNWKLRKLQ